MKSCEQDAAGREGNFFFGLGIFVPGGEGANFLRRDVAAVFGAKQVLEQNAEREREMFGGDALLVESVEAVEFVFLVADFKGCAGAKAVGGHEWPS